MGCLEAAPSAQEDKATWAASGAGVGLGLGSERAGRSGPALAPCAAVGAAQPVMLNAMVAKRCERADAAALFVGWCLVADSARETLFDVVRAVGSAALVGAHFTAPNRMVVGVGLYALLMPAQTGGDDGRGSSIRLTRGGLGPHQGLTS